MVGRFGRRKVNAVCPDDDSDDGTQKDVNDMDWEESKKRIMEIVDTCRWLERWSYKTWYRCDTLDERIAMLEREMKKANGNDNDDDNDDRRKTGPEKGTKAAKKKKNGPKLRKRGRTKLKVRSERHS